MNSMNRFAALAIPLAAVLYAPNCLSVQSPVPSCPQLGQPIFLGTGAGGPPVAGNLIQDGFHLSHAKFDKDPIFPKLGVYVASRDSLNVDGFEIISNSKPTIQMGVSISVSGSSDPSAQMGFPQSSGYEIDSTGYQSFIGGTWTFDTSETRHFGPGSTTFLRLVHVLTSNGSLTSLALVFPILNSQSDGGTSYSGTTQTLCLVSADAGD